jgi:hypothetical protein
MAGYPLFTFVFIAVYFVSNFIPVNKMIRFTTFATFRFAGVVD